MKLNELKAELKEIEKQFNNPAKEKGRTSGARVLTNLSTYNQEIKKTKIEYLKKGISACKEILNSQKLNRPMYDALGRTADNEQEKVSKSVFYPNDNSEKSPVQTQFSELEPKKCFYDGFDKGMEFGKQRALSQRNKEILDIIDKLKMKHTKEHGGCGDPSECCFNRLDVLDWDFFDELKQQLTNSEGRE